MKYQLVFFVFAAFTVRLQAQVYLGAEMGPDAFIRSAENKVERPAVEPFAEALSLSISSATLCSVFESTAPEKEITAYLNRGFYRQELITLILAAEQTKSSFKKLAAEIAGGSSLEKLAKKHDFDLLAVFGRAGVLQKKVEAGIPDEAEIAEVFKERAAARNYDATRSSAPVRSDRQAENVPSGPEPSAGENENK